MSDINGKKLYVTSAKTDADGKYAFKNLLPGTYTVAIAKSAIKGKMPTKNGAGLDSALLLNQEETVDGVDYCLTDTFKVAANGTLQKNLGLDSQYNYLRFDHLPNLNFGRINLIFPESKTLTNQSGDNQVVVDDQRSAHPEFNDYYVPYQILMGLSVFQDGQNAVGLQQAQLDLRERDSATPIQLQPGQDTILYQQPVDSYTSKTFNFDDSAGNSLIKMLVPVPSSLNTIKPTQYTATLKYTIKNAP
ncbi:hypothetical protein MOO45_06200 [Bombilactobacillus folatiphilus]|uniref:SD-repeat containing protein B domain-containing protein n=1 Tax=Bombilactobacillus folatiphilus TaxID=2923362 RepID=A0ABY4P866_9LACO|nr:SdrD B-like domain-containing protein [Bombilactobacillus folatiphilus]UQS81791.1 hypothetical protein MOO45_06200 [Bombilactobacillus folatiphilus]